MNEFDNTNFRFINPFLIRFKKSPNLISLYQTYINEKSVLDFTSQNNNMEVQFIAYQIQVARDFSINKEYTVTTAVMPNITIDSAHPLIKNDNIGKRNLENPNDLRVIFVIYNDNIPVSETLLEKICNYVEPIVAKATEEIAQKAEYVLEATTIEELQDRYTDLLNIMNELSSNHLEFVYEGIELKRK